MKFKEIINKTDWNDIKLVLYEYYYKKSEDCDILYEYEKVFNELKILKEENCQNMRLYIEKYKDFDSKDDSIQVIGRNGELNKESEDFKFFKDNVDEKFANSEITYALEMIRWEKWLDMKVPFEVFSNFSMPEIVAHSLFEMTFIGFSQDQIQDELNELIKRVEEIKNGEAKTISLEEFKDFFKDLDKDDLEDEDNEKM
jgi:hypothetical protein